MTARIARFAALGKPAVAEVFEIDWQDWLTSLERDPGCAYAGKFAHPGWSPAEFDPPSRSNEHVQRVHALVLDFDRDPSWDKVIERWEASYGIVYTTKSHTDEHPRLRVVLPLLRPVTRDEYARVWDWGRRASLEVGLEIDIATKDPARFWYAPSTPAGTWRAQLLTGAFVDPDAVLALAFIDEAPKPRATTSAAPPNASDRERRARAYARKLPVAIAGEGGHTQTFNAVCKVMHGFDLDDATVRRVIDEEYNPRCVPPWSEHELDHKITSARRDAVREPGYLLGGGSVVSTPIAAAAAAPALSERVNVDWRSMLDPKPKGGYRAGFKNVRVMVRHHPRWMGRWTWNEMTHAPWLDGRPADEHDAHDLREFIDDQLKFTPSLSDVQASAVHAALDRKFHPLQIHLRSLEWDGVERLRTMAADHLLTTNVSHNVSLCHWMISAVARAFKPGLKVDTALILTGPQGHYKSTFLRVLGGAWFTDTAIDLGDKDRFLAVASGWIIEIGEIEYLLRSRASGALKTFLTSAVDNYRAPYAKANESHPRSSVFAATTNHEEILEDETGSRRWAVIPVTGRIDIPELERVRDQLWAEALVHYESGARWWNDHDQDLAQAAANAPYAAAHGDTWLDAVADWSNLRSEVTIRDALELACKMPIERHGKAEQMRMGRILTALGFRSERPREHGQRKRVWVRGPS